MILMTIESDFKTPCSNFMLDLDPLQVSKTEEKPRTALMTIGYSYVMCCDACTHARKALNGIGRRKDTLGRNRILCGTKTPVVRPVHAFRDRIQSQAMCQINNSRHDGLLAIALADASYKTLIDFQMIQRVTGAKFI